MQILLKKKKNSRICEKSIKKDRMYNQISIKEYLDPFKDKNK